MDTTCRHPARKYGSSNRDAILLIFRSQAPAWSARALLFKISLLQINALSSIGAGAPGRRRAPFLIAQPGRISRLKNVLLSILALALIFPFGMSGCASQSKVPLRIFYAGSLIIPFQELKTAFEAANPGIQANMEGHGSIQVLRQVSDLHDNVDVAFSADESLIPMLLYQSADPQTGKPNADWYIRFATNEMAIAYSAQSKYANEINADNWFEILNRPDVRVGIADPRFDANGYRALMVFKLAEDYYNKNTIFADLMDGQFKYPITAVEENQETVIHVPELVETTPGAQIVVRGYSVQILPLIESGDIDYAFEYLSVIEQHNLTSLRLPLQINLSDPLYRDRYRSVVVNLGYQRFASVKPEFRGEVIGYGLTIPENASHPQEAEQFIAYLLGPEGQKIMKANQHPTVSPPLADHLDLLPPVLKALCQSIPATP